jgi:hypothetical protein
LITKFDVSEIPTPLIHVDLLSRASNYEKRMDIDPLANIPGPKGSAEVDVEYSAAGIPYTTKA